MAEEGSKNSTSRAEIEDESFRNKRTRKSRQRRKNTSGTPSRPLSAYNIFFTQERRRIIAEVGCSSSVTTGKMDESNDIQSDSQQPIGFLEMAKLVSQRWHQMTEEEVAPYKELAKQDLERYRREQSEYQDGIVESARLVALKSRAEMSRTNPLPCALASDKGFVANSFDDYINTHATYSNGTKGPNFRSLHQNTGHSAESPLGAAPRKPDHEKKHRTTDSAYQPEIMTSGVSTLETRLEDKLAIKGHNPCSNDVGQVVSRTPHDSRISLSLQEEGLTSTSSTSVHKRPAAIMHVDQEGNDEKRPVPNSYYSSYPRGVPRVKRGASEEPPGTFFEETILHGRSQQHQVHLAIDRNDGIPPRHGHPLLTTALLRTDDDPGLVHDPESSSSLYHHLVQKEILKRKLYGELLLQDHLQKLKSLSVSGGVGNSLLSVDELITSRSSRGLATATTIAEEILKKRRLNEMASQHFAAANLSSSLLYASSPGSRLVSTLNEMVLLLADLARSRGMTMAAVSGGDRNIPTERAQGLEVGYLRPSIEPQPRTSLLYTAMPEPAAMAGRRPQGHSDLSQQTGCLIMESSALSTQQQGLFILRNDMPPRDRSCKTDASSRSSAPGT